LFFDFDYKDGQVPRTDHSKPWDVDVLLKKERIAVEYDGSYWHREKQEQDLAKTKALEAAGLTVIRVRRAPLKALGPNDIVVSEQSGPKEITNALLLRINELRRNAVEGLENYLSESELRARARAEEMLREDRRARSKRPVAIQLCHRQPPLQLSLL